MADCFFDDTAPGCPNAPVPEPTPVAEDITMEEMSDPYQMVLDDEHEFWEEYGRNPLFAKLAFIAVASQGLIYASLKAFRHRIAYYEDKGRYEFVSAVVFDSFDWVMWADYIAYYGAIALFGLGWITQLLDLFGVATYINFLVWGMGLGVGGSLVASVAFLFVYIAYEQSWNCMMDDVDVNQSLCATINADTAATMRTWAFVTMSAWMMVPVKQWVASQYFNLPEDKKEKYR